MQHSVRSVLSFLCCLGLFPVVASSTSARAEDDRIRVAVSYFENTAAEPVVEPLRKGFAEMLATDLATSPQLVVVERARLDAVLQELKLGTSAFMDEATVRKLGKGLGATHLVVGSYLVQGPSLRVDTRLIDVATSAVAASASEQGSIDDVFSIEGRLVAQLVGALDASVNAAAYTGGFAAFSDYSRGVDALDKGEVEAARALLAKASGAGFTLAQARLDAIAKLADAVAARARTAQVRAQSDVDAKLVAAIDQWASCCDQRAQAAKATPVGFPWFFCSPAPVPAPSTDFVCYENLFTATMAYGLASPCANEEAALNRAYLAAQRLRVKPPSVQDADDQLRRCWRAELLSSATIARRFLVVARAPQRPRTCDGDPAVAVTAGRLDWAIRNYGFAISRNLRNLNPGDAEPPVDVAELREFAARVAADLPGRTALEFLDAYIALGEHKLQQAGELEEKGGALAELEARNQETQALELRRAVDARNLLQRGAATLAYTAVVDQMAAGAARFHTRPPESPLDENDWTIAVRFPKSFEGALIVGADYSLDGEAWLKLTAFADDRRYGRQAALQLRTAAQIRDAWYRAQGKLNGQGKTKAQVDAIGRYQAAALAHPNPTERHAAQVALEKVIGAPQPRDGVVVVTAPPTTAWVRFDTDGGQRLACKLETLDGLGGVCTTGGEQGCRATCR